jgi:hypothetical protein
MTITPYTTELLTAALSIGSVVFLAMVFSANFSDLVEKVFKWIFRF